VFRHRGPERGYEGLPGKEKTGDKEQIVNL
jgi:hypothetical protein